MYVLHICAASAASESEEPPKALRFCLLCRVPPAAEGVLDRFVTCVSQIFNGVFTFFGYLNKVLQHTGFGAFYAKFI